MADDPKFKPTRRELLQAATATGLFLGFQSILPAQLLAASESGQSNEIPEGVGQLLPDDGWRLWPDTKAEWKNDTLYLPDDVVLDKLPVNPPTGGWSVLTAGQGTAVTLPSTVEQHYWGEFGLRTYAGEEYRYEPNEANDKTHVSDPVPQNGAYYGVSWWWREIDIPAEYSGKRIYLHVRGARQRAEVYLNGQLTGYSMLEELPFECDLSAAAKPGQKNLLAIRITNPGGRFDWVDGRTLTWSNATIQKSHGFGGLDRALRLSAHGDLRVTDSWVLNTPDPHKITAFVEAHNHGINPIVASINFAVLDQKGQICVEQDLPATIDPGKSATFSQSLAYPRALLWSLSAPALYRLRITVRTAADAKQALDSRTVPFGFRWFAPEGVGTNALFRLNGQRIRLYSAISWGFWGMNGLFPTPELALKEVKAAQQLGLNCLNFHRNPGKEDVLTNQDRLGLLRFMEPGGGAMAAIDPKKPEQAFQQRYEEAKILHMIRTFRSHPSVVGWTLQNEGHTDLTPQLYAILARMHEADPSRCVVANDGFTMRSHQAWYAPYDKELRTSPKPGEPPAADPYIASAGGWWDEHQAAGSDVWLDSHWKGPDSYQWRSANTTEIVQWGEMEGSAMLDNHAAVLRDIAAHGGKSYDLLDHKEINDSYEKFLDKWGFRHAFPTAESLYLALGLRCYDTWRQYMENARICDVNDYLSISGWESTAPENHSGIVDAYRNFKADPKRISESMLAVRPVAKQHQMVYDLGETGIFDLYLLNETYFPLSGTLTFSMTTPSGRKTQLGSWTAPAFAKDQFSYLIMAGQTTPPLNEEGKYLFEFALSGGDSTGKAFVPNVREILVTSTKRKAEKPVRVGLVGTAQEFTAAIEKIQGVSVKPFSSSGSYDLLIATMDIPKAAREQKLDTMAGYKKDTTEAEFSLPPEALGLVRKGTPLFVYAQSDAVAEGAAKQLSAAGAFKYTGLLGLSRAPWMGAWYFVREHAAYAGMPVNCAMGPTYQVRGNPANGWLVDGPGVEIIAAYSRDHDRHIAAGTMTAKLGKGTILMHRVPTMQKVLQQRFYVNAIEFLTQPQKS